MTSVLPTPTPAAGRPPLRTKRNPRLIAIGLLAASVGGLGTALAYQQAGHSQSIIIVTQAVARGEVVEATDLGVTTIGAAPGIATLPSSEMATLIGKEALVDLPKGSVVGAGSIGQSTLAQGMAQLGLKLGAGRIPTSPMSAGTPISLVAIADPRLGPTADAPPDQSFEARVVSVPNLLPDGSSWTLDVAVAERDASAIAGLAASDRLVVVRKAGQ